MEWVQKALDTVVGANLIRQDLSAVITVQDGRPRPFLTNAPNKAKSTAIVHTWDEQGLIGVGAGAASYQDGTLPPVDALAAIQPSNKCCRIGKTASVTDDMVAAFTGGGQWVLADGQMEKLVQGAIDYQTELKTREVLDEMEWMHISGDQTISAGFPGGQTDGLMKWILANGTVTTPAGATSGAPVAIAEAHIKSNMRTISQTYPTSRPNTILVPPEIKVDFNGFAGSGAGAPLVRIIQAEAPTQNLIAGSPEVTVYDSGYGLLNVREEPNLSPLYNPLLTGHLYVTPLLFNDKMVDNAPLRPLGAETLARIATSVQRMVTTTTCQEHRLGRGTGAIQFVKSGTP